MWRSKRPTPGQTTFSTRGGMDQGDLYCLLDPEGREDPVETAGQHRLAPAGRAMQQEVMATSGGDLDRPPGEGLPLDFAHVAIEWGFLGVSRPGAG
jgi:hypothetical protein